MKHKRYLCIDCAHKNHDFTVLVGKPYSLIDNKKYISYHRSPSQKVICSDCGKKEKRVFEEPK